MTKKKISVGVVGAGFIAREVHLPLLAKFPEVKLTGICDQDEDKLSEISRLFPTAKLYTRLDEMLSSERLDLVDICTPPLNHAVPAIQAMQSGCNCMVEKPIAMTVSDTDRMIQASRDNGVSLCAIHNYSFMPCVTKARRMVASGEIGKLLSVEIKYLISMEKEERYFSPGHWCHSLPGGILNTEITPHLVMLLLDFLNSDRPECVQAFKGKLSDHSHIQADELRAVIKGDNNTLGTLSLSYNCPFKGFYIFLAGTEGYIQVNINSQAVVKYKPTDYGSRSAIARGLDSLSEIYQLSAGLLSTGFHVVTGKYTPMVAGHKYLMSRCWRHLRGEGEYPVDLERCRDVIKIMEYMFNEKETT